MNDSKPKHNALPEIAKEAPNYSRVTKYNLKGPPKVNKKIYEYHAHDTLPPQVKGYYRFSFQHFVPQLAISSPTDGRNVVFQCPQHLGNLYDWHLFLGTCTVK